MFLTDDITLYSNGVGGSGENEQVLASIENLYINPPLPLLYLEWAACAEFESSPTLEWTGSLEVSRGLTFST